MKKTTKSKRGRPKGTKNKKTMPRDCMSGMASAALAIFLLLGIVFPVSAEVEGIASAKLDMPNLVRFSPDVTLGFEAGKDLYNILPNDNSAWVEDDKGYYGVAKLTVKWTLLDFSK